ncbi:hsp90-like protein [Apiospora arundinis]|uniref:histidine kinase n=1 Tax=Apiospora arundinis TaxID=335852 RepID=A0ABR2IFM2_9PEZI
MGALLLGGMPMPTSQLTQQPNDALDAGHDHAVNSEALEKNVELERELSSAQNSSILPGHGLPHEDAMLSPRMQSLAPTDAPEWTPGSEDANNTDGLHLRGGGPSAGKGQETPLSNPETNDMPEGNASVADALPSLVDEAKKRKAKEVSIATGSPEVIDSQSIINQYRERLARDLERREQLARSPHLAHLNEKRPSPIREEMSFSSVTASTSSSDLPTASTESNKTVRGGSTPAFTPGLAARTPSYPFPRMATPSYMPSALHRAFSGQSSVLNAAGEQFDNFGMHDQLRSDPSTPASAMTFQPYGSTPIVQDNFLLPTPNLYELSLMLTAEPGLDAWWSAVVQIMKEHYKAERMTLSIPADSTDLENVPWGQKATYNNLEGDGYSMRYMGRGSSMVPSSRDDVSEIASLADFFPRGDGQTRPTMLSRHSFTSYEDKRETRQSQPSETPGQTPSRPTALPRSKSYYPTPKRASPTTPLPKLNKEALQEHDAVEEQQPSVPTWEAPLTVHSEVKGRVLPVLQGLDLEADPLIDHNGIQRVIERGKVIALTRSYPYLDATTEEPPQEKRNPMTEEKKKPKRPIRASSSSKLSSLLGNAANPRGGGRTGKSATREKSKISNVMSVLDIDDEPRPPTPKYEEYEQTPPSPWSQSPAPSPAVRADPSENPFFTEAMVDEDSFNPGPSPHDYTNIQAPETIGVDNAWTVLHIPLKHILLSKPAAQTFKLDPAVLEQKGGLRNRYEQGGEGNTFADRPSSAGSPDKAQQSPIAILSILTPVIPYPSNLRYSLEHLAPHLATSFSLSRHYSNLETELAGVHRKRPTTSGFGALGPDGRPIADPLLFAHMPWPPSENPSQRSITGSMTSPSDSGPSRSAAGSPGGTPNWDPTSFGLVVERRTTGTSPGNFAGDGYFGSVPRHSGSAESISAQNGRSNLSSKEPSLAAQGRTGSWRSVRVETLPSTPETDTSGQSTGRAEETLQSVLKKNTAASNDTAMQDPRAAQKDTDELVKKIAAQSLSDQTGHKHTRLHSYGAEFSSTFQSLPSGAMVQTPSAATPSLQRQNTITTTQVSMLPPTDRLKGLMLDSLPAHVFVAMPVNGEIMWVNSKYLTYRGQTIADLVMDPWGSLHPEDRDTYLQQWTTALRTGDPFAHVVRIRRFDGVYRWHQARAVASKDKRGVIIQYIGSYMDIHDQKIAELRAARQEEVEASEAKHRLLANLIPQIIFTATEEDGITFANQQWLSYTGQAFDDAMGVGFMDYVHPDDLAKCRIPTEKFSSTPTKQGGPGTLSRNTSSSSSSAYDLPAGRLGELAKKQGIVKVATDSTGRLSYTAELRLRSKSGEYRWHLIRCVEIDTIDFGTGESSYFGSATDINDHKLLEEKLKEAMESKSRFLSNMSHEIRTPLIGISGMVSFLQDTTLNEEQRDYTNTIQTSANSLLMIINDILDLSKVDAGMMKLNFEWFHTRSLIEDVNELVSTMAIAKRLELNYVVEEDVPFWVKGDKVRIRQVLLNVIGNAIKFTAQGEVFSRCKVLVDHNSDLGDSEIVLEFSIIDTGRGFSKEEAELIFKPFSQIDGSSTRQHGGSGLGLVISRQLVELHGGKMDGTAVPGQGSTFTFSARFGLPTDSDHPDIVVTPPTEKVQQPSEDSSTRTVRPVVVDKVVADSQATSSPGSETAVRSPTLDSSASSDPSVKSVPSQATARSSVSSVNVGLVHFSEAAKASGQDLSQMKLEMPSGRLSPSGLPTPGITNFAGPLDQFRPPMYSILIVCPQTYSREATAKHIEMTLPKDIPHQITALATATEAQRLISGEEAVIFTHIVLNLGSPEEIIAFIGQIMAAAGETTSILVLTDSVQRQSVLKLISDNGHQKLVAENKVSFVYKPVKPSRFAAVFDPAKSRDLSIDRNRSSALQMVETQKQNLLDVEKRIGNKGYKVLLVEDNPVNQKVLVRYLKKVGIVAEIAADGVECTEAVFSRPPGFYSLILCDLHMPRKDGYQACREIREWEKEGKHGKLPIIALSANVMSDVQEKCVAAGFSDYVTKPVDFADLSTAMSKYF